MEIYDIDDDKLPSDNLSFDESARLILVRLIERAKVSDLPKDMVDALNLLHKQGYTDSERDRRHDIEVVMGLLTDEQLSVLEGMV